MNPVIQHITTMRIPAEEKDSCKGTVILMHPEDFIDFQNEKGSAKDVHCPHITDSEAQFRRNETKISWKSSFTDQDYKESKFLKLKFRKQCKNRVPCPQKGGGWEINAAKKEKIVKKLVPLMEQNSMRFWLDMPCGSNVSISMEHLQSTDF